MIVIFCIALILLAAVFVPRTGIKHWLAKGWEFPRLQFLIIAVICFAINFAIMSGNTAIGWTNFIALSIVLFYLPKSVLPYTILGRKEVLKVFRNPANSVSILCANVQTENKNANRLIKLVKKYEPDLLVTLESDDWWEKQMETIEPEYPFTVKCPLDNRYGIHLYSKYELIEGSVEYMVEDSVPSVHALVKLPSGRLIQTYFLHPAPPSPTENETSEERDDELRATAKLAKNAKYPVIVAGDLNDVAWSKTTAMFRKNSGLLDPRRGRGMYNTYNAKIPIFRWPLDHVFHSKDFGLVRLKRLGYIGSDHFPIFAEVSLGNNLRMNPIETTNALDLA